MDQQKDKTSPATTSSEYDEMKPRWDMIEALLGGTESMREAGRKYLPQHPAESDAVYQQRLSMSTLNNMFELTLSNLSGRPFSDRVKLSDNMPELIRTYLNDIDMQGNNVDVFLRSWFQLALGKGYGHVLVDQNQFSVTQGRTLADDRKEAIRPYLVLYSPEQVLDLRTEYVGDREIVTHVRIYECDQEPDGFATVLVERIRVLEPGRWVLYRAKTGSSKKKTWYIEAQGETGIDEVPLVTFYTDRRGVQLSKPPLLDLAYMNTTHWQSTSNQRMVLTVARFPMLAVNGEFDASTKLEIGPNKLLWNPDPNGKFYYVEHTGAAIEAGRNDLRDLEEAMGSYGAEFLKIRPGRETATARSLDSAESMSSLQAMVLAFEDAVARALYFMAKWSKLPEGGTVELVKDFVADNIDSTKWQALDAARGRKDISRETYVEELRRMGVLDEKYDSEADKQLIDKEVEDMMQLGMAVTDLDPNAPDLGTGGIGRPNNPGLAGT